MQIRIRTQDLMRVLCLYEHPLPGTQLRLLPSTGPRVRAANDANVTLEIEPETDLGMIAAWLCDAFVGTAHELCVQDTCVAIEHRSVLSALNRYGPASAAVASRWHRYRTGRRG